MQDMNTDMVSEHQEVKRESSNSGSAAGLSPKDEAIVKKVKKNFEESKKHKAKYDEHFLDYYKFFRGTQWEEGRPSYRHSEVINLIFSTIQSMVPIMMDVRPKVEFMPKEPSDQEFAEVMNELFISDWEANYWLNQTTEVVYDGHIYGTGFSKMEWDPDANYGMGKIVYKSVDPFYVFPDPESDDINDCDSEFFIIAEPKVTKRLKRKYPKKSLQIQSDMVDMSIVGDRTQLGEMRFRSPVNNRLEIQSPNPGESDFGDKSLVMTQFTKSQELKEEKFKDEDGKEKYRQMLKEPKGSKVVIAGGAVVENIDELPYDDLKFPYSKYENYMLPREFWGVSEIENLKSPQMIFNKIISFMLDVLTITGNPVWILDTSSGVDPESIFNRPGLIVEKEPGSEVRREAGTQLQPYVLQLVDRMENWFNEAAGNADVSKGIAPASVTANAAIENLLDAAQTRIRQKMRNLDTYLVDVGQQYASRVMQFYTQRRVFRITNKDGSTKYFRFNVDNDEQGNKVAVVSDFVQNEYGEMVETEPRMLQVRGELDVRSTTGTGLPFSKSEKEQRLLQLFDRGIIDAEEVLKGIDYPNAEKVLTRVAEKQQAEAEAAMAAQGQA